MTVLSNRNLNNWRHLLFCEIVDEKNNISSSKRISSHCGCCHTAYHFSFEFSILYNLYEKFHICKHSFDTKIWLLKSCIIKSFSHIFSFKMFSKKVKFELSWIYITPNLYGPLREPELYYNSYCIWLIQMNFFQKDWSKRLRW